MRQSMSASRLFWKLFLSYAAISLVGTVAVVTIFARWHRAELVAQAKTRLHDAAAMLSEQLDLEVAHASSVRLQKLLDKIAQGTELRIAVLSAGGKVLAASDRD